MEFVALTITLYVCGAGVSVHYWKAYGGYQKIPPVRATFTALLWPIVLSGWLVYRAFVAICDVLTLPYCACVALVHVVSEYRPWRARRHDVELDTLHHYSGVGETPATSVESAASLESLGSLESVGLAGPLDYWAVDLELALPPPAYSEEDYARALHGYFAAVEPEIVPPLVSD